MAKSWGTSGGGRMPAYLLAFAATVFVCSSFAAVASWVVLALHWTSQFAESRLFVLFMLVKALAFSALAAGTAIEIVRRVPARWRPADDAGPGPDHVSGFRWELIGIAICSALLFLPNLHRFPSAAPDELHHLTVARNLAVHGAYASGLAPDHLVYFDHYDSVGAPVIGAVAESFRLLGVSVAAGRVPMALFGIAFPISIYWLFAPWGRAPATIAALATLGASGTIYLGRTLYGEVPALTFLVFGLVVWRRGLATRSAVVCGAAGLLFGLAVLTKTILAIAAFAFLGAWIVDRVTSRQIASRLLGASAAGGFIPLAAWSFVEFLARDRIVDQPSTLLYYRHMLTAGFEPLFDSPERLLTVLLPLGLTAVMLAAAVPRLFRANTDAAMVAFFLIAPLFAFWWIGFTPMHIPRYLWYTAAVAAGFGGALAGIARITPRLPQFAEYRKAPGFALVLLAAIGYGFPALSGAVRVYTVDQTEDDRALVEYVNYLPTPTRIATSYWPVERLLAFELEKCVDVIDQELYYPADAVVIVSDRVGDAGPADVEPLRFGHYRVYEGADALARRVAHSRGD